MSIRRILTRSALFVAAFIALASPSWAYTRYYGRIAGTGDWSGTGGVVHLKNAMETWDNWYYGGGLACQEPCTKSWIMDPSTGAIAWLNGQADSDDLAYFHFGGHGGYLGSDPDGDDALTPVLDDEIYGNASTWYITDDQFADAFQTINGGRKVFLMETCCAGGIVGGTHDLQPGENNLTVGWTSAEDQDSTFEFVVTLRLGCTKADDGYAPADYDKNHIITVGEWLEYARLNKFIEAHQVGWAGGGEDFPILYDNTAGIACSTSGTEGDYRYEYVLTNNSWQDNMGRFGIDLQGATVTDISAPEGWTWYMMGTALVWEALGRESYIGPGGSLGGFALSSPCTVRDGGSIWGCEFTGFDDNSLLASELFMGQYDGITIVPGILTVPEPASAFLLVCGLAGALGAATRRLRRQ